MVDSVPADLFSIWTTDMLPGFQRAVTNETGRAKVQMFISSCSRLRLRQNEDNPICWFPSLDR